MRLSTKGRYAVTAMMDIALHQRVGPVTLADISQCQGISLSYLEQLFAKLRKGGLVEGVYGSFDSLNRAQATRMPANTTLYNDIFLREKMLQTI